MPPTGGYEPVQYRRNLPVRGFRPAYYLVAVAGIMTYGFYKMGKGIREQKCVDGLLEAAAWSVVEANGITASLRERRCGHGYTSSRYYKPRRTEIKYGGITRSRRWRKNCWARKRRLITVIGMSHLGLWGWVDTNATPGLCGRHMRSRRRMSRNRRCSLEDNLVHTADRRSGGNTTHHGDRISQTSQAAQTHGHLPQ
jgi:hypothetical protein